MRISKDLFRITMLVVIFSIAMGFLETAVVVYLRRIFYPDGFQFPIIVIDSLTATTELIREAATIIMLLTLAAISGKDNIRRFAFFLLAFGIWDLTYYVGLKLILNWPLSITDWDILFLIPIPWFSPVLAPCIVSSVMIWFAYILLKAPEVPLIRLITLKSWMMLIAGSLIIILSFVLEFLTYSISLSDSTNSFRTGISSNAISGYMPETFLWWLFLTGMLLITITIFKINGRNFISLHTAPDEKN